MEKCSTDTVCVSDKMLIRKVQIERANEYLLKNIPNDSSEPSLEWCIISDLLRIIENK